MERTRTRAKEQGRYVALKRWMVVVSLSAGDQIQQWRVALAPNVGEAINALNAGYRGQISLNVQ